MRPGSVGVLAPLGPRRVVDPGCGAVLQVKQEASGQLVRVRDKMTSRLAKANAYTRHLESQLRQRDRALLAAAKALLLITSETERLAEAAADGGREAPFVVDTAMQAARFEELSAHARRVQSQVRTLSVECTAESAPRPAPPTSPLRCPLR